jgi:hypothetical protein
VWPCLADAGSPRSTATSLATVRALCAEGARRPMLFHALLAEPGPWGRRSVAPSSAEFTGLTQHQRGVSRHGARRVCEGDLAGDGGHGGGAGEARLRGRVRDAYFIGTDLYGYAPRGERLRLWVPRKRGKNTTLLSSMSLEGMGPSLAVEGASTRLSGLRDLLRGEGARAEPV